MKHTAQSRFNSYANSKMDMIRTGNCNEEDVFVQIQQFSLRNYHNFTYKHEYLSSYKLKLLEAMSLLSHGLEILSQNYGNSR